MIDESGYDIRLEIDGGCGVANIKEIAEAGVDMFVAGSAILKVRPPPSPPALESAVMLIHFLHAQAPRTVESYKETIDAMRAELAKVPSSKVAA